VIGSVWLFVAGIFIVFLIIYFLLPFKKVEVNKLRKNYFNGMKLIFDFAVPPLMIPISSVKLNDHCVTGYPRYFFRGKYPITTFYYALAVIVN